MSCVILHLFIIRIFVAFLHELKILLQNERDELFLVFGENTQSCLELCVISAIGFHGC